MTNFLVLSIAVVLLLVAVYNLVSYVRERRRQLSTFRKRK
ncbi:small membrane protein [Raoultella lignicola]|uniref:Small membrane protein n=1 Tax=Raoultella lignicola TaxID=3040939 RepID=A0ABU9FB62_9ENTR|nr:small membrane protein [Klebsiella pneumoniae]